MYTGQFLPFVIQHFKFARLVGSIAFKFDAKTGKFVPIKCQKRVLASQIQYIITLMYVGLLFHSLGGLPVIKILQGFPILLVFVLMLSAGSNVSVDMAPVQIINSILNFEKNLLKGIRILWKNIDNIKI